MKVPVITAVTDAEWEARLLTALDTAPLPVSVVRRCVDLADLLAVAATGTARAAVLSADLRRLDREAAARLTLAGLAVVGVSPPGDAEAEHRLRQLGVAAVVPADAGFDRLCAAVVDAVAERRPAASTIVANGGVGAQPEELAADGRLVAVWGPTGAPGRTSVAVALAAELADLRVETLLVDADAYGGVVAQVLGLLDESPGLAAAARLAANGTLDLPALADIARSAGSHLRLLTGITRAQRWPELRPSALEVVYTVARELAVLTVVDCGFSLEQDEELSYDTAAPRRNGATIATLEAADVILAVGSADPVGLQRLVRGILELRDLVETEPRVIVNRVRRGAVGGNPERQIAAALGRYAGVSDPVFVPFDPAAFDAALISGRALAESAPQSGARLALRSLAAQLAGLPAPRMARGLRRRRVAT